MDDPNAANGVAADTGQDSGSQDSDSQDPVGQDSAGQDSAGQDSAGQDSAGQDSAGQDSAGQDPAKDPNADGGDNGLIGAPEAYGDFTVPDGMEIDTDLMGEASTVFKECNINQKGGQKLVDMFSKYEQNRIQQQADGFTDMLSEWETNSKNDKEFGGDNFDKNLGIAKQGLDAIGSSEWSKVLANSGLGSHPETIRALIKVGNMVREDHPGSSNRSANSGGDIVSRLYPNNKIKE